MRSLLSALTLLLLLGLATACASDPGGASLPLAETSIVTIVTPDFDSLTFYKGEDQTLVARITDSYGRTITPAYVQWVSSLDAVVGTTTTLQVGTLSLGTHVIELAITYADQSVWTDTLSAISVIEDPWADSDLLNDHELRTERDLDAPYVRDAWSDWIKTNHFPLRSLSSVDFADLTLLEPLLQDKVIVQMGEAAHGIAEHNRIRVRLVKYLHEELGFNVIAFESGLYECYFTNLAIDTLSARNALTHSLYSFWHTTDLLDLFEYIKTTRATPNPIQLAGFDLQPTGTLYMTRPAFLRTVLTPIDPSLADSVYYVDLTVLLQGYEEIQQYSAERYAEVTSLYGRALQTITDNMPTVAQTLGSEEQARVAAEVARSAGDYIEFRSGDAVHSHYERVAIRDNRMAENFAFLKETVFPGEKIVIWAHNAHIQMNSTTVQGAVYPPMMGLLLRTRYPDEIYTIGSLMYRGVIDLSGQRTTVSITTPESIEAILYRARVRHFFLDIASQQQQTGNEWLFQFTQQTYHHRSGNFFIWYVPKDQYDAIIFVDSVNPPSFIH
jgi:erythromycin esterase